MANLPLSRSLRLPPFVQRLSLARCPPPCAARCLSLFNSLANRPHHEDLQKSPNWVPKHHSIIRLASSSSTVPRASSNPETTLASSCSKASSQAQPVFDKDYVYHGPLAATFRRLKIFSLSSLTLCFVFTPFIFVIETTSAIPLVARFALAGIALSTSGVSTALVAWCARPYVSTLRWTPLGGGGEADESHPHNKSAQVIEMTTLTLGLHQRITKVYDSSFLVPTSRPFAKWELAEAFKMPAAEAEEEKSKGELPREETVAETTDKNGAVVGRWVVRWDAEGNGQCYGVGQTVRYFNVHEELLDRPIH